MGLVDLCRLQRLVCLETGRLGDWRTGRHEVSFSARRLRSAVGGRFLGAARTPDRVWRKVRPGRQFFPIASETFRLFPLQSCLSTHYGILTQPTSVLRPLATCPKQVLVDSISQLLV
jgi:hypothetical protein